MNVVLDGDPSWSWYLNGPAELPDRCQQFACPKEAETWCPLCRAYLCKEHDPLYPVRRHDCLKGKAEAA